MSRFHRYFLIVDGSSLLATSYYATLPRVARKEKDEVKKEELLMKMLPKNEEGVPVNALRQFFHTLLTILHYQHPTHMAICWDISRHTFRKELWPQYKANRSATPDSLRMQFEAAYDLCDQLGFIQVRDQEFEADDFAGSLAAAMQGFMPVRILTRDKDYFQLISPRVKVWYGMSDSSQVKALRKKYEMNHHLPSKVIEVDQDVLLKEFHCTPEAVIMLKSLSGDASDNIPGVSGMGANRSLTLAMHYKTPGELYADIQACPAGKPTKALNKKWRSWGIFRTPFRVLTRPAEKGRYSAQEMCYLCYELGKIRTDIPLSRYLGFDFHPDAFVIPPVGDSMLAMLAKQSVPLPALEKKMKAFTLRKAKHGKGKPTQKTETKKAAPKKQQQPAKTKARARTKPADARVERRQNQKPARKAMHSQQDPAKKQPAKPKANHTANRKKTEPGKTPGFRHPASLQTTGRKSTYNRSRSRRHHSPSSTI